MMIAPSLSLFRQVSRTESLAAAGDDRDRICYHIYGYIHK